MQTPYLHHPFRDAIASFAFLKPEIEPGSGSFKTARAVFFGPSPDKIYRLHPVL
jgi:hypothetical protein